MFLQVFFTLRLQGARVVQVKLYYNYRVLFLKHRKEMWCECLRHNCIPPKPPHLTQDILC